MNDPSLRTLVERQLEVASLSGEVHAVMHSIVERLLELPLADGASLSTCADGMAHFEVSLGADGPLQDLTCPLTDTLGSACVQTGELRVLRGSDGADIDLSLTEGAGAIVLAPIVYDGETRGILGVRSADPEAFDKDDIETARLLAQSAAIALRNAALIERLADSERRYRELYDQSADATLVSDLDGKLLDANEAAAALLWYTVDELRTMNARELFEACELEETPPRQKELRQNRELRAERKFRRKDGAVIEVEYSSRVLDDGRVHTALRDVTQRKRNEDRLRTSLGRLHAIVETQREISALELDPEAVTAAIVERAQRLAGADGASVQWFEGSDSVLRQASGVAAAFVGLRLDRATSLAGLAALTEAPVYSPDTANDPRVDAEACRKLQARSLICAPLYRESRIEGVLSVVGTKPEAFDELAVETTRLMAEFVSTVIRNANELETRKMLADELRTQGQVVEHMQTGLWIWSPDETGAYRLDHANRASELATGVIGEAIVGATLEEVLPATTGELKSIFERVRTTGELVDAGEVEYGDARIEHGVFWIKAFPLPADRIAMTFENVTEMVRARRALQESEGRFRSAFHSASLGMALTALDGNFVQVNNRLAQMLGYEPADLSKLNVRDITHPDDIELDVRSVEELRSGERDSYQRENRYVRRDGSVMWAELTVSLVRGYDGSPTHVVSHVKDITAQREANLLFAATFEHSVVPMLVADDERRLVDLNEAAAELMGVPHDEAVGIRLDNLLPDEAVPEAWKGFMRDGTWEAEVSLKRPDGGERRIEFVATSDVRPGRHIAVVRDLTRTTELETQLRQAQKMEAVGRLAGGIAHDFNNLLTAISGYSEFLIEGLEDGRLRRHADEIRKAAARAASLTGQLLAFSRRQVLQPRALDLNAVVSDMDMMLRRLIGEDVELVTLLDPNVSPVQADPTQVEQVIVNLAVNARDAMPNGGSVTIETTDAGTDEGDFVELRMTDTGIGMTDLERQQLFDPFFTTKEGGTGLGLATVYGIVEQSGGTIEVDTAPGMGSSFRIWLPRAEAAADLPAAVPAAAAPRPGDETILLVEDETVVRHLVAEILENSGYTVLQAGDGPSALELLRRHSGTLDLLVTDVVMPGMSGPEVAQAVTSMRPRTQVLYTSGYTDSAIGHHGVLEPGIAFLQKPFSADDLTRKVRALLDEASIPVD
ncbi:MAG TPA: PAS domain S-box protein [Gaiellaceae bacterium]|nr:PAS domain S-box protein [Gaiellaceae bacterium]